MVMDHIPHVTVETNLTYNDARAMMLRFPHTALFQPDDSIVAFPSFYDHNPLTACGWFGRLSAKDNSPIALPFPPHMSIHYFQQDSEYTPEKYNKSINSLGSLVCSLYIADTTATIPKEWKLLNVQ